MIVPCGSCPDCLIMKAQAWSIRLLTQESIAKNSYFITLTYADEYYPGYLKKKDLQNWLKRYRRKVERKYGEIQNFNIDDWHINLNFPKIHIPTRYQIKYYAVGEYGERTHRAHYHAIVFNVDINLLLNEWRYGYKQKGTVTKQSINYVTGYIINKQKYGKRKKYPPFSIMSKGIGKDYFNRATKKYHYQNFSSVITLPGGEKFSMPRYIKEKIFGCDTAIKLIGEKNRIAAEREAKSTDYSEIIGKRNYQREKYNRKTKLTI